MAYITKQDVETLAAYFPAFGVYVQAMADAGTPLTYVNQDGCEVISSDFVIAGYKDWLANGHVKVNGNCVDSTYYLGVKDLDNSSVEGAHVFTVVRDGIIAVEKESPIKQYYAYSPDATNQTQTAYSEGDVAGALAANLDPATISAISTLSSNISGMQTAYDLLPPDAAVVVANGSKQNELV